MSNKLIKVEPKEIQPVETGKQTKPNIVIGTLNVFANPAKQRYHRFYHPDKNSWWWWNLGADLILLILVIGLAIFNIYSLYNPVTTPSYGQINYPATAQPQVLIEIRKDREIVKPGDKPTYTIAYKNNGKQIIQDLLITINLEGQVIGGKKQVVLSSAEYPELKSITVGTKGEIKKVIELNKNIVQPVGTNLILTATVEANYKNTTGQEFNSNGNKILQKTTTELTASAFARYTLTEGDQIGVGPLPPTVGQTTRYWIFFAVNTGYNDIKNFKITAELPTGIKTTGKLTTTSKNPITINPDNSISWQVDSLTAPSANYPQVGAGFEVEITPTIEQVGKTADLLTKIRVSATDMFTGEVLNIELPVITTGINDDGAKGIIKSR